MPMKPKPGESQSDFMARCMSETFGDDAPEDRTQEQAVAICMGYWRDSKNLAAPPAAEVKRIIALWKRLLTTKAEAPDPEDYDDREEFISDCVDAIDDEEACAMLWSERSSGADHVHRATHAEKARKAGTGWHFVLSDESEDRMGDIISADGWKTDSFKRNPVALFAHDPTFIVGRWHDVKVNGVQLRGRLELAPEGTSPRIDEIRRLVDADILRAVSVGFRATKREPLTEKSDPFFGPFRFLEQELVECSLVAVPANANALALAKSLKVSTDTLGLVFAEQRKGNGTIRRNGATGEHAATSRNRKGSKIMSTLSERIAALQTDLVAKEDALTALLAKMDNDDVQDDEIETTTALNADIAKMRKRLDAWLQSEKLLAKSTDGNGNGSSSRALTVLHDQRRPEDGNDHDISAPHVIPKRKKELAPLEYLVRAGTVAIFAKDWQIDPIKACEKIYGDDEVTRVACGLILRTATAPAMTTVPGWAQELAQQTYAELMPQLIPQAVYTRFAARGLTLQFGRAAKIVIPTRSVTPTIAGSFVGEGAAIPVRIGAFTSQNLTPKKLAVITVWTREMSEHSTPAIEGVLREAIQTDTSVSIDSVLIDANPATTTRPAGLLNGVAAQTPTTGPGLPAIIGDLKLLVGVLTTSTKGNIRNPVFLMNPGEMLSASLANTNGIFPFKAEIGQGTLLNIPIIDSATIPTRTVILVDAADFVTAGGGGPRFELSDSATLHMEDTTPLELVGTGSPGTVASPQRSLFQTDSIALRMIMPLNWLMRRSGCVAWVNNVNW